MKILLFIIGFLITINVSGQKYYFDNTKYISDSVIIEISNAVIIPDKEYFKCRMNIVNKTNDLIVYKSSESNLHINGKNYLCNIFPDLIIPSKESKYSRTILIEGIGDKTPISDSNKTCELIVNGIYKKKKTKKTRSDSLVFGDNPKDYLYGNLIVKSGSCVKKTREAWQKFTVINKGNTTAIVDLSKVKIRTGEHIDVPIGNKNTYFIPPSKSVSFKIEPSILREIADMQFAVIYILWKDSFDEIILEDSFITDVNIPLSIKSEL